MEKGELEVAPPLANVRYVVNYSTCGIDKRQTKELQFPHTLFLVHVPDMVYGCLDGCSTEIGFLDDLTRHLR